MYGHECSSCMRKQRKNEPSGLNERQREEGLHLVGLLVWGGGGRQAGRQAVSCPSMVSGSMHMIFIYICMDARYIFYVEFDALFVCACARCVYPRVYVLHALKI